MFKINKYLVALLGIAMLFMVIVTVYDLFLKPTESVPPTPVRQVDNYIGQDVLDRISGSGSELRNTDSD